MASGTLGPAASSLQRLFLDGTVTGLTEAQLLDRFLHRRDETAFASLVERHGPMVLAVCRRVLRDEHAAEDAFQATFLLLVRRAKSIRGKDALGPWLYRVAYRVSVRAGRADSRRKLKESSSTDAVEMAVSAKRPEHDLRLSIHEVLDALPEKYRAPVVLCDLQGWSHDEAAKSLHWPIGSVKGRLSRARDMLRTRLARQGLTATSAALAVGLSQDAIASIPPALILRTIEAAKAIAAGRAIAAGLVPASATALVEEAVRVMIWNKIKLFAASMLAIGMLAGGAGVMARQQGAKDDNATGAKAVAPKTDLEKLQGDWVRVQAMRDGKAVNRNGVERLTIQDDIFFHRDHNGKLINGQQVELLLDKSPSRIRLRSTTGPTKGQIRTAIYKIEGDLLTVCESEKDPSIAPTEFDSNDSRELFVYRRDLPPPSVFDPALTELDKLQGDWKRVSMTSDVIKDDRAEVRMTIRGGFSYRLDADGTFSNAQSLEISPDRSPGQIRSTQTTGPEKGRVVASLYTLEGDRLTLCSSTKNPDVAPADFGSTDGRILFVYQRENPVSPPVAAAPKVATDLEKLQGRWERWKYARGNFVNEALSGTDPFDQITIRGDSFLTMSPNGEPGTSRTLHLDASANPKRFEWVRTTAGNDLDMTQGIYDLTDDKLTISFDAKNPKEYPKEFATNVSESKQTSYYRRAPHREEPTPEEIAALKKLQGAWIMVGTEKNGEDSDIYSNWRSNHLLVIDGNKLLSQDQLGGIDVKQTLRLDHSRTPFVMELQMTPAAPTMPPGFPLAIPNQKSHRRIYKLDGDRLIMCVASSGTDEPKEFVTRPGDGNQLQIFRRQRQTSDAPLPPTRQDLQDPPINDTQKPANAVGAPGPADKPVEVAVASLKPEPDARPNPAEFIRQQIDEMGTQRDQLITQGELEAMEFDAMKKQIESLSDLVADYEISRVTGVTLNPTILKGIPKERVDEKMQATAQLLGKLKRDYAAKKKETNARRRSAEQLDQKINALAASGPPMRVRAGKPGTIQAGDILVIDVLEALPGRPITGERIVRPDGTVSLGFYGEIHVVDLTRNEIKTKVVEHLQKFLADETLGLVTDDGNGTKIKIKPADSDRVVVDDSANYFPARGISQDELTRKLDQILRELNSANPRKPARGGN